MLLPEFFLLLGLFKRHHFDLKRLAAAERLAKVHDFLELKDKVVIQQH
jgi:hypothetical protein